MESSNAISQFEQHVEAGTPAAVVIRPAAIPADIQRVVDQDLSGNGEVSDDEILAALDENSDYELADIVSDGWTGEHPARDVIVAAVANFRARFLAAQPKPTLILTIQQAQAVYGAMCALNNVSGSVKASIAQGRGDEIRATELDDGSISILYVEAGKAADIERYADQSAFAAAYGLDLAVPASDAQHEAVAVANAHLNNAALPTFRDLNKAVTAGAPAVIGFAAGGARQADFDMGWRAAMERVYNRMQSVIVAQRAINNAEQSDE